MGVRESAVEGVEGSMSFDRGFYKGKRVLVTGHTGFKGAWLCRILIDAGAVVTGYALSPPTKPALFDLADIKGKMTDVTGDIRDLEKLRFVFEAAQPEIVLHLAAQPIVRASYKDPHHTYETNVMGTVDLMECVRQSSSVRSVLNVTTDKVYQNKEWCWGYREDDPLNGFDPYSNSKSCSELVTDSYRNSFFSDGRVAISTVRAGNVIGGGDFARDRIIPDCVRAVMAKEAIGVRNPRSIRPYQHVLEPLAVYLMIAKKQYQDIRYSGCYNVGPDDRDYLTTGELVRLFCRYWGAGAEQVDCSEKDAPHEAGVLKLDNSKLKSTFGWRPRWDVEKSVEMTCRFMKLWSRDGDIPREMDMEIEEFTKGNG